MRYCKPLLLLIVSIYFSTICYGNSINYQNTNNNTITLTGPSSLSTKANLTPSLNPSKKSLNGLKMINDNCGFGFKNIDRRDTPTDPFEPIKQESDYAKLQVKHEKD